MPPLIGGVMGDRILKDLVEWYYQQELSFKCKECMFPFHSPKILCQFFVEQLKLNKDQLIKCKVWRATNGN